MFDHKSKKSIIDNQISTVRLETLSDGVFAIAMTLLVLEIHAPDFSQNILSQVLGLWPHILSFALSFVILGMFWVAHQTEFKYIKKLDNGLIWLNIFYLLFISLLPFSADLLGQAYMSQTAVVIYGVHLIIMVVLQYAIWLHAYNRPALLEDDTDEEVNQLARRLCFGAVVSYVVALAVSFWSLPVALILYAIVPLPYIFGLVYKL